MEVESKKYSWKWVTADELLSHGACELLYALLDAGAADDFVTIYNGENTSGDIIAIIRAAAKTSRAFAPKVPVYCRRGLYVDVATTTTKVFVQWRELGHKGEGS